MAERVLRREQLVAAPLDQVFEFFSKAENLELLTPRFLGFKILTPLPIQMRTGTRIEYRISLFGVPMRWRTRIDEWTPGARFVDVQERGPYALWHHTHEFEARGSQTLMRDIVRYRMPLGPLGTIAHAAFVERTLGRIFDYRAENVRALLAQSA